MQEDQSPTQPPYEPPYPEPTPPPYEAPPTQPPYPYPQPLTQPPVTQPPVQPPRKNRRTLWIVLGSIGGVLLLCCVIIVIATAASGGFNSITKAATATSAPATATPTVNPNASAPAYLAAIEPLAAIMQADFQAVQTDCSAGNLSACSSDSQKVHDDAANLLTNLYEQPAPPCLKTADTKLREGLKDYQDGSALVVQGINNHDTSMIMAGRQKMDQGNTAVNQATTELTQASC
jgi:hypothetical protein